MESMQDFKDQAVVVTGAGRGIGKATALAFAQHGAKVGLAARTTSQLEETAEEIDAIGGRSVILQRRTGRSG